LARQRLGQHFLVKGKALERIASAACGDRTPLAVEIGPGRGALTETLLKRADRVAAVELDSELVDYLRARWPAIELIQGNALDVDWSQWGAGVLTGNLPYYIATPIVSRYLRQPGLLSHAVFLIQKEVAERITARPGTRAYGYFSVECQFLARTEYLFTVPPGAFRPPPKVDSAVIRLTPKITDGTLDVEAFLGFVSICFRLKRKTLRNNLRGTYEPAPDIAPWANRRAEELSVDEFVALYRALGPPQGSAHDDPGLLQT
jgi:16S rRNA (adenine1518-N6/adenine1519-N6)-dimethyltransferase